MRRNVVRPAVGKGLADAWGRPFKLVKVDKKWDHQTGHPIFDEYRLISAGPDGKFDTDDDVKMPPANQWQFVTIWWMTGDARQVAANQFFGRRRLRAEGAMAFGRGGGGGEFDKDNKKFEEKAREFAVPGPAPGGPAQAQGAGAIEGAGGGWPEVLSDLKTLLETGKPLYV